MRLEHLHVAGFRSLKDTEIDFDDLTLLIGPNDSGKSSVLDAVDILLTGRPPDPSDYHCQRF
jgi:putative ATP-dependent endonuclease of the OLD family